MKEFSSLSICKSLDTRMLKSMFLVIKSAFCCYMS